MQNTGETPETGDAPLDIVFRNGTVKRGIIAKQWRWKPWDWGQSEFDIVRWQIAGVALQQQEHAA